MRKIIVLLGPPGAGKGTQAEILRDELKLTHVSSGDLFRENVGKQTGLGKLAKSYMDRGELVPDDVTIAMVKERISRPDCDKGVLLDGFPRTPAQADALAVMLGEIGDKVSVVPYISAPTEVLIDRLSGRWTCRAAGHIYHIKNKPPKVSGICDEDGSELYQRDDDKAETVSNRIRVYLDKTASLIDYYKQGGLLIELDGTLPPDMVSQQIIAEVEKG
ncbi:MAG: adenylate kinase [Anaerolineaceae bacterium]|jgi:adenylate kinase